MFSIFSFIQKALLFLLRELRRVPERTMAPLNKEHETTASPVFPVSFQNKCEFRFTAVETKEALWCSVTPRREGGWVSMQPRSDRSHCYMWPRVYPGWRWKPTEGSAGRLWIHSSSHQQTCCSWSHRVHRDDVRSASVRGTKRKDP